MMFAQPRNHCLFAENLPQTHQLDSPAAVFVILGEAHWMKGGTVTSFWTNQIHSVGNLELN